MVEIQHQDDGVVGRFFVEADGELLAEMTYKWHDSYININHTEVDDRLRGQSIGARLVAAAVQWARDRQIKIAATCPFAKAVLQKKEEYSDVYYY